MASLDTPAVAADVGTDGRTRPVAVAVLGLFVALTIAAVAATRFPLAAGIPLCVLGPAFILATGRVETFARLKLATLIVGRTLVPCAVLGLIGGPVVEMAVLWLYRINILEAVVEDARKGRYANALAGFAIVSSTALIAIRWVGEYYVVGPAPFLCAAIAYTIWNWNFIVGQFPPTVAVFHVATLAAPLFCGLAARDMGVWLIIRATSLTVSIVASAWMPERFERLLEHPEHGVWRDAVLRPAVQRMLSAVTLAFVVASIALPRFAAP